MTITMGELRSNLVKYVVLSRDYEIIVTDENKEVARIPKRGTKDGAYSFFAEV